MSVTCLDEVAQRLVFNLKGRDRKNFSRLRLRPQGCPNSSQRGHTLTNIVKFSRITPSGGSRNAEAGPGFENGLGSYNFHSLLQENTRT